MSCTKTTKPQDSVTTPSFSPIEGTYLSEQTIQISCATSGAIIHYTLDGTDPTASSSTYSSEIGITQATTIKARAYKSSMKASAIASATYEFNIAGIQVYPASGTYYSSQTVAMSHITQGTVIHYTIDGTDPTITSPTYSVPITVDRSLTLKARGFKEGWTPTPIVAAVYTFVVPTIYISPLGGAFTTPQTITISTTAPGTIVHYTTNGDEPTETSATYTDPVLIEGNTILKAKGFMAGWTPSMTVSATYAFNVTPPAFSIAAGTYYNTFDVSMSTPTAGATMRYTLDGSDPTASSTLYTAPVAISSSSTLKAKAFKNNWNDSGIASVSYTLKVVAPTFNPLPDTYTTPQSVTIATTTPGTEIYYTTDGSDPYANSTLYTGPVLISTTSTLKARAYKTGWSSSNISSAQYIISATQTVATPTFNPPAGSYNGIQVVSMLCSTSGSTIRYTTDNSEPTSASTVYATPISIGVTTTLKAKAFKTGWNSSQTAEANYNINFLSQQMVLVPSGTFSMGRTSGAGETDELPVHSVTLSSFYMSKYEVIQADWNELLGNNPSYFSSDMYKPVEDVSWYAAIVYCNTLSIADGLIPVYSILGSTNPLNWGAIPITLNNDWNAATMNAAANGYRLPTEAEWEYAARGGVNTPDYTYSGSNTLNDVAWTQSNSGSTTHPVGQLAPNGLGIYDMTGNVHEWCWDWYSNAYYAASEAINPTGPAAGSWRILRGGSWNDFVSDLCRVPSRNALVPYTSVYTNGLRIVKNAN